jgi:hypothetical protein
MSFYSSIEPNSPAQSDNEVDLREVVAALQRRWPWLAGGLILGMIVGGIAGLRQLPTQELQLVVNLERGPKTLKLASEDSPGTLTLQPAQDPSEVRLLLEQLASKQLTESQWSVNPLKQGRDVSESLIAVSASVPASQLATTTTSLERLGREFEQRSTEELKGSPGLSTPQKQWTQVLVGTINPSKRSRTLALGGLAGLVIGCGAGLVADRRYGRIYSLQRLRQLLPYPVWGTLPTAFPDAPYSGVAVAQLSALLDPTLSWRVLSIATPHPLLNALVSTLQQARPSVDVASGPTLLREAFAQEPSGTTAVGCLLLVQSGFNSEEALAQAHGLLKQLPGIMQVALVVCECTPPPELRSRS